MEYKYISGSIAATIELAQNIESEKFENMVICLNGDLGSGKTLFSQAFARSLGIKDNITSPTFNIVKEYDEGQMPLTHMDVYRLVDGNDDFGIEEYYEKGGICLIEWSDLIEHRLPNERLEIKFIIIDENRRKVVIKAIGEKYIDLCESVL